jgi:hypothetical protein
MIPRRVLHLLLAGSLWGGLAWLLGAKAFGPVIWAGILASPLIGLLVGWITQEAFERLSGVWRGLIVLASVYLGATFFGLAVGIYDWFARHHGIRLLPVVLVQDVAATWWGVTVTGFILMFWPLAYLTHTLLEWGDEG